jgi:hypothetical protein
MANNGVGATDFEFTYANRIPATGNSGSFLTQGADYNSIVAMRNALAAFDPITYTATELDRMTTNDMVFALRNIKDPTTIAPYMTAQVART